MTEEECREQTLNNLDQEANEIEEVIINLSDKPHATESLLASLADLHDTQAQILYGVNKHFDSGTLYAPPEAELAADEAAVPEQDSGQGIRIRAELMQAVNEAVMKTFYKGDPHITATEAAFATKAVFDKYFLIAD